MHVAVHAEGGCFKALAKKCPAPPPDLSPPLHTHTTLTALHLPLTSSPLSPPHPAPPPTCIPSPYSLAPYTHTLIPRTCILSPALCFQNDSSASLSSSRFTSW